jgi:PQQ-dependent catabolism-associated CXXCW motif protein
MTNGLSRRRGFEMTAPVKHLALAIFLFGILFAGQSRADDVAVVEPAGYRMDNYKSPVPATLEGAQVITTKEAAVLWEQTTAVFFDVMPRLPKPDKLPASTIWRDKPRLDIPGSIWLANVGYGEITRETADYFRAGLAANTGGDKSRKIVIYCMTDCWMSWNAAKRAVSWGYGAVAWYPEGADGWERSNRPLVEAKPFESK